MLKSKRLLIGAISAVAMTISMGAQAMLVTGISSDRMQKMEEAMMSLTVEAPKALDDFQRTRTHHDGENEIVFVVIEGNIKSYDSWSEIVEALRLAQDMGKEADVLSWHGTQDDAKKFTTLQEAKLDAFLSSEAFRSQAKRDHIKKPDKK